jgi:2,3-diketo-5-methylthio-1-phosphopentane phosphatase
MIKDRALLVFLYTGERIVEQLAPELLPMLVGIDGVANFIPITNTLLSEIQRRGVSRDQLLTSLQQLGATELPPASVAMLQDTQAAGVDVKILSDCNSVFISHILAGARAINLVKDIITNTAAFEWAADMSAVPTTSEELRNSSGSGTRSGGHKLVIKPCQGAHGLAGHTCSMCPENLCKGVEVRNIRSSGVYQRVVYAGDGMNDICPALCLGPKDVVLARAGHPLAEYLQRAEAGQEGTLRLQASYKIWNTHEELRAHVQVLMLPTSR